ncbi:MAG: hypothetical protein JWO18_1736 [Microbacteriaceae bacterium]|nr:hypothetical protein [Microbacteriaceae bacterium]
MFSRMTDESNVFTKGEQVGADVQNHPITGIVIGSVPNLGNVYYVQSKEGDVCMYDGRTLTRA